MRLAFKLFALALGTAMGLLFAECAVRLGAVHDPIGEYLRVEGETESPRARLLLLGDSFVDKRTNAFHGLVVEALEGEDLAIANLAVSGTGPAHYLDVLRQYGEDLDPDLVVLFYFAGNDLINVIRYEPERPIPGAWGWVRDRLRPLLHASRLYHAVTERSGPPEFDFDAMLADGHDPDLVARARTGEVNPWLLLIPREERARYLGTNLLIESPTSRQGVAALREILRETAAEADRLGARLAIVVFPATTQVSRSHFDFYTRAGFDPDERTLSESAPQRLIAEIAEPLGIPVLDLLPDFRRQGDEALYRPFDSHLNDRGNALAVARVAPFVVATVSEAPRGAAPGLPD